MGEKIKHTGVVESVDSGHMMVRILQTSACAGCKAASFCNASEKKEKLIDIYDQESIRGHKSGDNVVITADAGTGAKAVIIGFGLPFVVLVAALIAAYSLTQSETIAAVAGIITLVPYYLIVYIFREKLRKEFSFTIDRQDFN